VRAGKEVFDWPVSRRRVIKGESSPLVPDSNLSKTHRQISSAGVYPFALYIIAQKGFLELASNSCGSCHTRVTARGDVIAGAQGTRDCQCPD